MKKILLIIISLCLGFVLSEAKDIKISVTPSDAQIYVDGNYVGDGVVSVPLKKKDGFIVVKFELDGYITREVRIFARNKTSTYTYALRKDEFYNVSSASGLVNRYFSVTVSKDLYTVDENGKKNSELAWKLIHQILLNYFDEIQTTDFASGFIQTPWQYETFPAADKQMRTRVSVKESNLGGDLTFQIKVSSEVAPLMASQSDESFQEIDRIAKEFEPIISEFQSRLGKL